MAPDELDHSDGQRPMLANPIGSDGHFQEDKLPVQRIEQQRDWYCGAACAVMTTGYYGIAWDQADAYNKIHDPTRFEVEQLYSDPTGLSDFLNGALATKLNYKIADCDADDTKTVIDTILRCLRYLKLPAICLTHGGAHWIVVDGIRYIERPDGSKDYIGVYTQNPWYNISSDLYVVIDEFNTEWMTPNAFGHRWLDKRVVMSDGKSTPMDATRISAIGNWQMKAVMASTMPQSTPDIESLAVGAVSSQGFANVRKVAGAGAPVRAPLHVKDADDGTFYWLVVLDATDTPEFQDFVYAAMSDDGQRLLAVAKLSRELDIPTADETKIDLARSHPGKTIVVDEQVQWGRYFATPSRFDVYREVTIDGARFFYLRDKRLVSSLDNVLRIGG